MSLLSVTMASVCCAASDITPNLDAPATLGPATSTSSLALPVESLRAVHGLDLSAPALAELPKLSIRTSESSSASRELSLPASTTPALIAPTNKPAKIAKAIKPPTDDHPPTLPSKFKPEWRSSGKGDQVADAFKFSDNDTNNQTNPSKVASETPPADQPALIAESDPPARVSLPEESKTKVETESESSAPAASDVATAEPKPEVKTVEAAKPLKPLTRNQIYLRNRLRKVLSYYYRKPLNTRENDAWEAMHGMLSYGLHSRIRAGGPRGESMTAIGWLCYNNPCKKKQLMRLNDEGEIRAKYGVGLQGHMGQFLAMLAQCNVDPTYPIRVENQEFTIADLIDSEKETCYPNTELTFKLIGLMHYLPSDSKWVNDRGESWSIERLIEEELKQPIRGAACGGTHRLGGLSMAVRKRQARDEAVDGAFLKAAQFTNKYEQYAYRLQNSDGSFSTEWFRGPGRESDINRRCRTSGHLLEWVLYQIEDDKLTSYRVVKGVNYLTNLLYSNSNNEWETGPLCHALHALALYDQRVFQPHDKPAQLANTKSTRTTAANRTSNSNARPRTSSRSSASRPARRHSNR